MLSRIWAANIAFDVRLHVVEALETHSAVPCCLPRSGSEMREQGPRYGRSLCSRLTVSRSFVDGEPPKIGAFRNG